MRYLVQNFKKLVPTMIGWLAILFFASSAFATDVPAGITYQGRIFKPDGSALEASSVVFTLKLLSPSPSECVLYQETQTVNMSSSGGLFSLVFGAGTRVDTSGLSLDQVFSNSIGTIASLTCGSGSSYNPTAGDNRKLRVSFNDGIEVVQLANDLTIEAVPFTLTAENSSKLGGKTAADFIQANANTTQSKVDTFFANPNSSKILSLVNGSPATDAITIPTGTTGQRPSSTVTGMIRYNTSLNQTEVFDGSAWSFVGGAYLPLAGGTMTGTLNAASNGLTVGTNQLVVSGGYVGVGNASPAQALDVSGSVTVSGKYLIGGNPALAIPATGTTAVGNTALATNTTAALNATAVGHNALNALTTGTDNTAVGYNALAATTTSSGLTAVGSGALAANITGVNNTAVGYNALNVNTGDSNTAMGYLALSLNTTGSNNTAFGDRALQKIIGSNNTAIGFGAMYLATSGDSNVAIGGTALQNSSGGSYNVAVGNNTMLNVTTASNNIAIGYQTGNTISTASNNILIGYNSAQALTTGNNNINIAYNTNLPVNNGSNQINIGSLIYATGATGAGAGNVGIGVATPADKLAVSGNIQVAKNSAQPYACDATHDAVIALTSQYTTCVCKGGSSAWVRTTDGSTACTW